MKKILITIIFVGLIFPQFIINVQGKNPQTTATHQELMEYYAPYIIQDLDGTLFGEYITCFHYDGNYIANDNWDNLGKNCDLYGYNILNDYVVINCDDKAPDSCEQNLPLPAYVYSSVIETSTHYFLCYALFHPADNYHHGSSTHENDFEGMIFTIQKDGSKYGKFRLATINAHVHFYDYSPDTGIRTKGIKNAKEDLEGERLLMYGGHHPILYVEGGGHGVWPYRKMGPAGWPEGRIDGPYIHYRHTGTAELSTSSYHTDRETAGGDKYVGYDLLPIASEFWQRRNNDQVFTKFNGYYGHRYSVKGVGRDFDCNTCMSGGAPHPPWYWDDKDDGDPQKGDLVMDPAWMLSYYYDWDESFSTDYIFHPFLYNHLGGETFGFIKSIDKFDNNPSYNYKVLNDIVVPEDNSLSILDNVKIEFTSGTKLISYGETFANGKSGTIYLVTDQNPDKGVIINGELIIRNGGSILFTH